MLKSDTKTMSRSALLDFAPPWCVFIGILLLTASLQSLAGNDSGSDLADTVYINAKFYTVNPDQPWVEAMAVKDGKIQDLGDIRRIQSLADKSTKIVDLGGNMVMPGIHDAHAHLEWSGILSHHECSLPPAANKQQIVDTLKSCETKRPGGWITAAIYSPFIFENLAVNNTFLNEAFPDTPVFLSDYSMHHGLANNKALQLAGISVDTANPPGGKIVRNSSTSQLTGELVETATSLMQSKLPPYGIDVYRRAVKWAMQMSNRYGITSLQAASASKRELGIFRELEEAGELSLRLSTHLVWKYEKWPDSNISEMRQLIKEHNSYSSELIDTRFIKMWLDGAPLPPNLTQSGLNEDGVIDKSMLLFSEKELNELVADLDAGNFTVKMHTAGKGSARAALNAIEYARVKNGNRDKLHELAHAGFVHLDDIARMSELGAAAEMSPALWHMDVPGIDKMPGGYKFRTLQKHKVMTVIGTDWVLMPTPNLFPALEGVLDREEDESVDLASALKMMTINGAKVTRQDHLTGSLEKGKMATFIVLNQNLFKVPVHAISETKVNMTVFEGKVVYQGH